MTTTIDLLPYQMESLRHQAQFLLWHGGRGSGKSHTLVQDLYNCCAMFPGGRFALVCNDLVQLRDSTHTALMDYLDSIGCETRYQEQKKKIHFPNRSVVQELTFEKDKTSLKGAEWDGIFADEADGRNTTEEKFDYLVDSCRGKTKSLAELQGRPESQWPVSRRIRVACNPVPPGHFLAKRFFINKRPNHVGYKVSTYMNERNLPPDYIERLEAKYPPGTDDHKRWMLGEMVTLQGSVYKTFGPENIVRPDEIPPLQAYFYGVDLGVNDPMVVLKIGICNDGVLYVTQEYYQAGMDIVQHMPLFRPMVENNAPMFCDHSATQHSIMANEGFNVIKAFKDVQAGIQMVQERVINNTLMISTDCVNLIQGMYNYVWRESRTAVDEKPDHKFSHAPDALRYGICGVDRDSLFY